jgi:outer membrane protein assembly factor BamB
MTRWRLAARVGVALAAVIAVVFAVTQFRDRTDETRPAGHVDAFDASTGKVLWQASGHRRVVYSDGYQVVLVVGDDDSVEAFQASSGNRGWTASIQPGDRDWRQAGGLLLVSGAWGWRAIDVRDGSDRWRTADAGEFLTSGDDVLVLRSGSELVAIDTKSGKRRWAVEHVRCAVRTGPGCGNYEEAALTDNVVIDATNRFTAFDRASGRELWSDAMSDVAAPGGLLAASGDVLVERDGNGLTGIDPATGMHRWRHDGWVSASPAINSATVIGMTDTQLVALDGLTGTTRWMDESLHTSRVPKLVNVDKTVVAVGYGAMTAYDPTTGVRQWRTDWPGSRTNDTYSEVGELNCRAGGTTIACSVGAPTTASD